MKDLKKEVDTLKGKIKEVIVSPKNSAEEGRSRNGIEQIRLNNIRARREEGPGKHGEWINVKRG